MRITKDTCEAEMILEFLSMELDSSRFTDEITQILQAHGISRDVIKAGDIGNEAENTLRRMVLGEFRGYGRNAELFENFPSKVVWKRAILENNDLAKMRYIRYSYWDELSEDSGSPLIAAEKIRRGETVYDVPNDGFWEAAGHIQKGLYFPPLILLTDETEKTLYLLEGHKRITAYALVPVLFQRVPAIVGYCGEDAILRWYGM